MQAIFLPRPMSRDAFTYDVVSPATSQCTVCWSEGVVAFMASRGQIVDHFAPAGQPEMVLQTDYLFCEICAQTVEAGDIEALIERRIVGLPNPDAPLPGQPEDRRERVRVELELVRISLQGRAVRRVGDGLGWQLNYSAGMEPGSLPVSGLDSWGRERDCHRWLADHPVASVEDLETVKETFRHTYAFAIPNVAALRAISKHSPIGVVEIGAGNGYWAYLLQAMGVDVKAIDRDLIPLGKNSYWRKRPELEKKLWAGITEGNVDAIQRESNERTLLIVWPSMDDSFGDEAIKRYRGDTVCYIGDWRKTTGDNVMHNRLRVCWTLEDAIRIPTFFGFQDQLLIYRRRPESEIRAYLGFNSEGDLKRPTA